MQLGLQEGETIALVMLQHVSSSFEGIEGRITYGFELCMAVTVTVDMMRDAAEAGGVKSKTEK